MKKYKSLKASLQRQVDVMQMSLHGARAYMKPLSFKAMVITLPRLAFYECGSCAWLFLSGTDVDNPWLFLGGTDVDNPWL